MRARAAGLFALFTLGLVTAVAVADAGNTDDPPAQTITITHTIRKLQSYQGRNVHWWVQRTNYWKRRSIALKRTLVRQPQVAEAINLACIVYGYCSTLWRKARCESQLYARALNSSSGAAGLLQFLPSTWASTPFAGFSVFSPYANVLAAGWMHRMGRGGEWTCR